MKNGKRKLTEKTIKQLNKMGMIWSVLENRWKDFLSVTSISRKMEI